MRTILKRLAWGNGGQAFILVQILLFIGSIAIMPLLSYMGTGVVSVRTYEDKASQLYAADAGVEDAFWQVLNYTTELPDEGEAPWGYGVAPVNDNNVAVSVEFVEDRFDSIVYTTYKVTAAATDSAGGNTTVESYIEIGESPFGAALTITDGGVKLEGTTVNGSVWADGNVVLEDSTVTGDVVDDYTGTLPELDPQPYEDIARGVEVYNGDLTLGAGSHILGPIYITGYLKIEEGATVQLNGIVYVAGGNKMGQKAIHIEAGATINSSGTTDPLAVIAEDGNIKIELCTFDVDPIPLVWAVDDDIEWIEENQTITAILYSPHGHIKLEQNVEIIGAVLSQTMDNVENCTITFANPDDSGYLSQGLEVHTWEIY